MPSSRVHLDIRSPCGLLSWPYMRGVLGVSKGSQSLSTFGNLVQCIVPLMANACLLLNAGTPHWRRNIFWMLLAMSCTLWMLGQFEWTYHEVYVHQPVPVIYGGDILFFLRGIPMMAALALRPHRNRGELQLRLGYLDFVLAIHMVDFPLRLRGVPVDLCFADGSPIQPQLRYGGEHSEHGHRRRVGSAMAVFKRSWRVVYANLFGARPRYMLSSLTINVAIACAGIPREACTISPCFPISLVCARRRHRLSEPGQVGCSVRKRIRRIRQSREKMHLAGSHGDGRGNFPSGVCDLYAAVSP